MLTPAERQQVSGLSHSQHERARQLGCSVGTLAELLSPDGIVSIETLTRLRARLAGVRGQLARDEAERYRLKSCGI